MSESSETSKAAALFGVLQSAGNFSHFVLASAFLFFTDSALLQTGQMGLAQMLVPKAEIDPSLYLKIVIILIAFSFYVSMAVIFFARIFWPLWIELGNPLLQKVMSLMEGQEQNEPFRRRPRRYRRVHLHELRTAAHYSKDSYLLKILEKEDQRQEVAHHRDRELSLYGLGALIAYCWNYLGFDDRSICFYLLRTLHIPSMWWFVPAVFFFYIAVRLFHVDEDTWVYCPTLHDELEKKDRRADGQDLL